MSNDTPNVGVLDPIAEFAKLKSETDEITAKIRAAAPLLNPSLNTTNDLLGLVLSELKMIRKEMNEIKDNGAKLQENVKLKQQNREVVLNELRENVSSSLAKLQEDVSSIKINQQNQEDVLYDLKQNISSSLEEIKEDIGTIKLEQQNQREAFNDQNKNLNDIKEKQADFQTKISALKCQPTIRDHIFGKWRDVRDQERHFSAMVKGNTLMMKCLDDSSYEKYTLGVKRESGCAAYVENNKIVLREFSAIGEETKRLEYSFRNGVLIVEYFKPGMLPFNFSLERIGDPDPE